MPCCPDNEHLFPVTRPVRIFALMGVLTLALAVAAPVAAQTSEDKESSENTENADSAAATVAEETAEEVETSENVTSDTTTLNISVSDSKTGEQIGGAKIYVITGLDSDSAKQTHPDVTTDGGTCTLADLPRGEITIIVSAQGMKSYKKNFVLGKQGQAEQTIAIELLADEPENGDADPPD